MPNIYTWIIDATDVIPLQNDLTNVITCVRYHVTATNGIHTAVVNSYQPIHFNLENKFIEFNSLTSDMLINWIKVEMGEKQLQMIISNLDSQIIALTNVANISPSLPWANQ
jgi:hypothetical protein